MSLRIATGSIWADSTVLQWGQHKVMQLYALPPGTCPFSPLMTSDVNVLSHFGHLLIMAVALSQWLCGSFHCERKVSTATHFQGERHA